MTDSVLVTGASRGIGLEFARQYALDGWRVYACCRNPARALRLKDLAAESRGRVRILELDMRDVDRILAVAKELQGEAIDVLINNAGLYGPRHEPFGSISLDTWLDVLRVNTIAPLKMAEAFVEHVGSSRKRIIASVTSLMGSIEDNISGGYYAYRTSKTALNMVNKSLSVDLRPRGITCVVLNPGWVRTDMGGSSAPTSVEESVSGMRSVIGRLEAGDSGGFFHFDGEPLPW